MSDPEADSPVGEPTIPTSPAAASEGGEATPVGDTDSLIAAQIRKFDAEADKAAAEAHRLEVFWTPRVVFQACIGGIVTAAFVAGWGIGYLRPLLTAVQLELQIDRHNATLDSIYNDSVFTQLTRDQEALSRERDSLGARVTILSNELSNENARVISKIEAEIQSHTLSQIERDSLELLLEAIRPLDISAAPVFTQMTVPPGIRNQAEIEQVLMREYPSILRDAGIGGEVIVWVLISEEGRVLDSRISQGSGHVQLDEAAINVADVFRFTPALNGDRTVQVWIELPIAFRVR